MLPAVRVFDRRDVDELVLLDIAASSAGTCIDPSHVASAAESCSVPLSVGGGITSVDQAQRLFDVGADRVIVNSSAVTNPRLITQLAERFGVQSVIGSIDAKRFGAHWLCLTHSATREVHLTPQELAHHLETLGAGELIITSVDRDGTMTGYDLELVKSVVDTVAIPVIASGGAGNPGDMVDAVLVGGASAVAASSLFHYTATTPAEVKERLAQEGIPVRT